MDFEEFFDAFEGDGPAEEQPGLEETTPTQEPVQENPAAEEVQTEEGGTKSEEGADTRASADSLAEEEPTLEGSQEQTFTIRMGEEDQTLTLEQVTELAQKGVDYDALQARFDEVSQSHQTLQQQFDEQQGVMDILTQLADRAKKPLPELVKQMYVNFRKSAGATENEATQELEIAELKKQMGAGKPAQQEQPSGEDLAVRGRREIAEFRKAHPGVALDDALIAKLKSDVQKGMSLTNAYQKMLNDQKAADLAEQERKLAAEKQNAKNKANSPGSQQDSGGRREKSGFEDFFAQFK